MANDPRKDTTTKYVNKDFVSLKRDLMRYVQAHASGAYQDFNETSPGMTILELQAYVADVLCFYMDQQFLELKQDTARQIENIESFAKMRGYKPKGKRTAQVPLKIIVEVPATVGGDAPNLNYAPILRAGSAFNGPGGIAFETLTDLDFSLANQDNQAQYVVSRPADPNATPTHYAIRCEVQAIAGRTVTEQIPVGDFLAWRRIELANPDVLEVLDVTDSDGNIWYEVDYLAQNMVFDRHLNVGTDSDVVPYVLKLRSASRRFVHEHSVATNKSYLQFGGGQGVQFDDEIVPDVAQLALPLPGRNTFTSFSLDPQNFLKTKSLGLSPSNTTLTVRYRVGGGPETNVPSRSIKTVANVNLEFKSSDLNAATVAAVRASLECINLVPSEGGGAAETISEIKANAASFFASQARCVTREDYLTHVLSMPSKFGRPEKAFVKMNANGGAVDIHMLSRNSEGLLQRPTPTLVSNVKTYLSQLRMMTEGVNVLPSYIINLGVTFGVVVSPKYNRTEVLTKCLTAIRDHLGTDKMQIGQPIVRSELETILHNIDGIVSVYKLQISSKFGEVGGLQYSTDISFDTSANTKHGILYCPENAIFEIRHPDSDIVAESK